MSKPWDEITFVGIDNSHPPQFWAWSGSKDETAEPLFRVTQAELVEQWNVMRDEIARLTAENERLRELRRLDDQERLAVTAERVEACEAARTLYCSKYPLNEYLARWPWLESTD